MSVWALEIVMVTPEKSVITEHVEEKTIAPIILVSSLEMMFAGLSQIKLMATPVPTIVEQSLLAQTMPSPLEQILALLLTHARITRVSLDAPLLNAA